MTPDPSATPGPPTTDLDEAIADLATECRVFLLKTANPGTNMLQVGALANELHFAAMEVYAKHSHAKSYVGWLAIAPDPPDNS